MDLGINCLLKNTQLFQDLSEFTKSLIAQRVEDGMKVDFNSIYRAVKSEANQLDIDIDTVGEIYKDATAQLDAKTVAYTSDKDVDNETGRTINDAVRRIVYKKRDSKTIEIEGNRPSRQVVLDVLQLFDNDFVGIPDNVNKTQMVQMKDALKKSAQTLLDRQGRKTDKKETDEILAEALRVDEMSYTDLQGNLNNMDDLFNQFAEDLDDVERRMIESKKNQSPQKKAEIDEKLDMFRAYRARIVQGAYTLAITRSDRRQVLKDLMLPVFGKDITRGGVTKRVLDYNQMSKDPASFEQKAKEQLLSNGYTDAQSDKIVAALKDEFELMRQTAQYNNVATISMRRAVEDRGFLLEAAAQVVMSKNNGKYAKWDRKQNRYVPNWEAWQEDFGTTPDQLADEIKADIEASGDASGYRQIISQLRSFNNPARNIKKGDLEKLAEMQKIHAFNPKFNAKVFKMMGLSESDAELAEEIEGKLGMLDDILSKTGRMAKITRNKLQNEINELIQKAAVNRSMAYRIANGMQFYLQQRNAVRLMNVYNAVQNNLFGFVQTITALSVTPNAKLARKNLSESFLVMKDVLAGGQHFDIANGERIGTLPTNYRYNKDKGAGHNTRAILNFLPNAVLGAADSLSHHATFMAMLQKGLVLYETSKLTADYAEELRATGMTKQEAENQANKKRKDFEEQAIDRVTEHFFNQAEYNAALKEAADGLSLVGEYKEAELKREATNILIGRIAQGDNSMLTPESLDSIVKAANTAALKSIGKESAVGVNFSKWVDGLNEKMRQNVKADLKAGNYSSAAMRLMGNVIVTQGFFPFVRGAFNFMVIGMKQSGLSLLRLASLNKKSFREQVANVAQGDNSNLEKTLESYFSRRQDIAYAIQGLTMSMLIFAYYALKYAFDEEESEGYLKYVDEQMKDFGSTQKGSTMLKMWGPIPFRIYNIMRGNIKERDKRDATKAKEQLLAMAGGDAVEPRIVKEFENTKLTHWDAATAATLTAPFEFGSFYSSPKSWYNIWQPDNTAKVANHDVYWGPKNGDFVNGLIWGLTGYGLNKELNRIYNFTPSK